MSNLQMKKLLVLFILRIKDLVALTEQILNSRDFRKQEHLPMLSQNHDSGLASESYFNALKDVTSKLKDTRIKAAVLLL